MYASLNLRPPERVQDLLIAQDAFAILLAAHHPALRLLGISTVHGNASLEQTTWNALSVLTAIRRTDIPVHAGAAKPFCRDAVHAANIHGTGTPKVRNHTSGSERDCRQDRPRWHEPPSNADNKSDRQAKRGTGYAA